MFIYTEIPQNKKTTDLHSPSEKSISLSWKSAKKQKLCVYTVMKILLSGSVFQNTLSGDEVSEAEGQEHPSPNEREHRKVINGVVGGEERKDGEDVSDLNWPRRGVWWETHEGKCNL